MLQLWFVLNSLLWPFNLEINGLKLGLNVFVLLLVGAFWVLRTGRVSLFAFKYSKILSVCLLLSGCIAVAGPCEDGFAKYLLTAPVLLFMVLLGLEIGWRASSTEWLQLQPGAVLVLLGAFLGFIAEAFLPEYFPSQYPYRLDGKVSGLFNEPSHVAFSLLPSIGILLIADKKKLKVFGLLAIVGLLIYSRSSTLIALLILWTIYRLVVGAKSIWSLAIATCLTLAVSFVALSNFELLVEPTLIRAAGVFIVNDTTNMSSLVYVQGWQDAWANFSRTSGFGLGFNMMGCTPLPDVQSRSIINKVFNTDLNSVDGSFLGGKIISETGFVGVVFFVALIWWWFLTEKQSRAAYTREDQSAISIQAVCVFSFIATSIIRSSGYFNGGFFLLVVAFAGIVRLHKEYNACRVNRGL